MYSTVLGTAISRALTHVTNAPGAREPLQATGTPDREGAGSRRPVQGC